MQLFFKAHKVVLFENFIRFGRTMIDQLRAIAIFHEVVSLGSFRAASRSLKLSPSVVSHHISQLENQLETALLYRSTRKTSLTDDGQKLFAASQRMIEAVNDGLSAIDKKMDEPSGRLHIAVTGNLFEKPPFVDYLVLFAKLHPNVNLQVTYSDHRVDLIGSEFDLAIRTGWLEDSQYKTRKLFQSDHVIIAAPAYMVDKRNPRSIDDLAHFDWVKLNQFPIGRQLTNVNGEVPKLNPNIVIEVNGVVAMCQMVKQGLGLAAVPKHQIEEELREGSLITLSPNWILKPIAGYAVWPNNVRENSLTQRFIQFLVEKIKADRSKEN